MWLTELQPFSAEIKQDWDAFVAGHGGLVYHMWDWITILAGSYTRMRNLSMAMRNNNALVGIFPLVSLRGFGFNYSIGLPHSSGGPIYENPEDLQATLKFYRKRCDVIEIHSYNRLPITPETRIPHLLVPLSQDVEQVRKHYEKNVRTALRRARRMGIRVRSSRLESDANAFYAIYEGTVMAQSGPSRISRLHLQNVIKRLPPERCTLLLAEMDGQIIGGLVGLFHLRDAFYWAAASRRGYNASELLLDELIQYSCENHERLFLGGGRWGVKDSLYFFKSRWGGVAQPAYRYRIVSGLKGLAATSLPGLTSRVPQIRRIIFQSDDHPTRDDHK